MGACYDVKLKICVNDETKAVKIMQNYIKIHDGKDVDFNLGRWKSKGVTTNAFEDLLQIFFSGLDSGWNMKRGRKWFRCNNGFDASYGWENIMLDVFGEMTPCLVDGSELWIYPDNDYDHLIIKQGKCIMVH